MNDEKLMPNGQNETKDLGSTRSISQTDQVHPQSSFGRLAEACRRKDLKAIESICSIQAQSKANSLTELLNKRDKYRRTLFHHVAILVKQNDEGEEPKQERIEIEKESVRCLAYLTHNPACDSKRLWFSRDLDGLTILHLAVISSNLTLVRHLLSEHPFASLKPQLIDIVDNEHHSPLHWAVISQCLDCVKLLLNSDCSIRSVHERDLNGATPLHYATQANQYPQLRFRLRQMLSKSDKTGEPMNDTQSSVLISDKNYLNRADSLQTAREQESYLEILRFLVKLPQANLECVDNDRRTPLLWAASSGNIGAVRVLVDHGADLNSSDTNDLGALHCAASHGFIECLEFLLSVKQSKVLVDQLDRLRCTPLFYSVLSGQIDCIEILLEHGAQPNWQDAKGRTAAHFAALKGQLGALKLLESRGANLWLPNKQGDLPLHYAIKSGRQQVINWLLEHSPYEKAVNAINNLGRAPIHLAIMRDNVNLVRYLIDRGANLNQLVKVRNQQTRGVNSRQTSFGSTGDIRTSVSSGISRIPRYRYETAYDIAKRLQRSDCLRLLVERRALPAAQVISNRVGGPDHVSGVASIFELHPAEGTSPIGLDTSGSSTSGSPASAMRPPTMNNISQNLRTSRVHSSRAQTGKPEDRKAQLDTEQIQNHRRYIRSQSEPARGEKDPVKGEISYNNERINASIKCKLYDSRDDDTTPTLQSTRGRPDTAGVPANQEIITNVNVYTSPCPHCIHHQRCSDCLAFSSPIESLPTMSATQESFRRSSQGEEQGARYGRFESPAGWSRTNASTRERDRNLVTMSSTLPRLERPIVPAIRGLQPTIRSHHLPPSQNHEQNLPPIPSVSERSEQSEDQTLSSTSASSASTSTSGTSPTDMETNRDDRPSIPKGSSDTEFMRTHSSRAFDEPRFDRSQSRHRNIGTPDRLRELAKSPVAEYISGGSKSSPSHHRRITHQTQVLSHQLPDFSRVQPKVDTRRSVSPASVQTTDWEDPRSISRQTMTLRPIEVKQHQQNDMMTTQVERSVRRYWQESKLFEELQNLKRGQIRSGKANEALLVKRLVERFHRDTADLELLGLQMYHGPYSFESYERYLYSQLRHLTHGVFPPMEEERRDSYQEKDNLDTSARETEETEKERKQFEEEDMKAELELRRVLESIDKVEKDVDRQDVETTDKQALISEDKESSRPEIDEAAENSPNNSSRRSSVEMEKMRLVELPLRTAEDQELAQIESSAEKLSSSIIVDALGNVTPPPSMVARNKFTSRSGSTGAKQESDDSMAQQEEEISQGIKGGRRKSVVNIGNKLEVIYHKVGIEIDPAEEVGETENGQTESDQEKPLDDANSPEVDRADESEKPTRQHQPQEKVDSSQTNTEQVSSSSNQSGMEKTQMRTRAGSHSTGYRAQGSTKIFNGHDLDKMRRRVQRESSMKDEQESAASGGHDSESLESQPTQMVKRKARVKRLTRRLEKSRLPEKRFEVRVSGDQVRKRWNRIKAEERENLETLRGETKKIGESSISNSKSQPNLGQTGESVLEDDEGEEEEGEGEDGEEENEELEDQERTRMSPIEFRNFILIYEINTKDKRKEKKSAFAGKVDGDCIGKRRRQSRRGQEKNISSRLLLCHKKLVRIVDVRALRRTISLPESLIYSNDLLKRFNILKY